MNYWRFKPVERKIVVCIGLVVLAGCSPRTHMKDVTDAQVQSVAKPTEAMVVFLRPEQKHGWRAISLFDIVDGKPKFIGILPEMKKIAYPTTPGIHRFMMVPTGTLTEFAIAELANGKSYYIRVSTSDQSPNLYLEPYRRDRLDSSAFSEDLRKTTWVVNTSNSRLWAERKRFSIENKATSFSDWLSRSKVPTLRPEDGR